MSALVRFCGATYELTLAPSFRIGGHPTLSAAFLGISPSAAAAGTRQVFEVFGRAPADVMNQGCEYYFFAIAGLGEATGAAATRTAVPVMSESDGLTTTLSDGVTP